MLRADDASSLTEHEHALLRYLAGRPGRTTSRQELLEQVWGWRARAETRAVDNTIMRLRGKVERDPTQPVHLLTVRGGGYRYEGPPALDGGLAGTGTAAAPDGPAVIGRDALLDQVADQATRGGLLTLWGPGGVGKTTLARALLGRLPGHLCELADLRTLPDATRALTEVLSAGRGAPGLGVPELLAQPGGPLIVLDNVEQLAQPLAQALPAWLAALHPGRTLLLTSRVRLGLAAERLVEVQPMLPDDAVRLLQRRSGRAETPASPAERALVQAVDCLPMAVELVAGWSDLGPPERLLAQIQAAPVALEARDDAPDRHRSVQQVLRASWDLLAPEQARALHRLSTFVGPFDLEAASAVLEGPALRLVGRLVDKSLLHRVQADGGPRFRMLELVRAEAATRLAAQPEEQARAFDRHAAHMITIARRIEEEKNRDRGAFNRGVAREAGDLAAVAARMRTHAPDLAGEAICMLSARSLSLGEPATELARVEAALPGVTDPALRVRLLQLQATWLLRAGRHAEADALLVASAPLGWAVEPVRGAFMECTLAFRWATGGRAPEAVSHLQRTLVRAGEDLPAKGYVLGYLGLALYAAGRLAEAERALSDALPLLAAVHNLVAHEWFEEKLAAVRWHLGRSDVASAALSNLLHKAKADQMAEQVAERSVLLGLIRLDQGELARARAHLDHAVEALAPRTQAQMRGLAWLALGDVATLAGQPAQARERYAQALAELVRTRRADHADRARARLALLDGDPGRVTELADARAEPVRTQILALVGRAPGDPLDGEVRIAGRVGPKLVGEAR